jgi:hypothetical protein
MLLLKLSHFMLIAPAAALLALSFFVLFTITRAQEKGVKIIGYVAVGLLWLAALGAFCDGVYKITQRTTQVGDMLQNEMRMHYRPQMVPQYNLPSMALPKKTPLPVEKKTSGCSSCSSCSSCSKNQGNKGVVAKAQ